VTGSPAEPNADGSEPTVRVLAVADEVDEALCADVTPVRGTELIVACGDLPFDYLGYLMGALDAPLVFVPGNHDPDVSGYRTSRGGLSLRAGVPDEPPWPPGALNADGRVLDVAGLRLAGLGGSPRYREGPNQYTERQQARRARRLVRRARWRRARDERPVDVLLTHAPPRGVGDREDIPHLGFTALHELVRRVDPALLLHGHVHPYGSPCPDLRLGNTVVRNVVGRHTFELSARGPHSGVYTSRHAP
jgi:calcineurin-like phosphoesterase family protein